MGTIVTKSNIESATYSNIFDILNNRSYIPDPRHPTNTSNTVRRMVYDYDPFSMSLNFSSFPYIILELPTLQYDKISANGKHKNLKWRHTMTVRTVRDGSGDSTTDIGRTDMLTMCDDINETFNSDTVKQSLIGMNMWELTIEKIRSDFATVDQKVVYESQFTIEYVTRLVVSA